ncbi:LacI family DNA-binding transcriptional regulator [Aureibacillus halotolerans]|uniref:LacI family transcriptional regulator n=1 Tax=Aureibacillus halotolerans TaxID=1508390 RepID=A0A4R6UBN8_9BACI|nr:LacI family DNA-binding transcriptional regulator [Aureibacillus halotolerans]TDQ42165.1 LacI family transcriptional regulator [Aureibacillus halotolerans]
MKVTVNDVAKEAGVSRTTVSRVVTGSGPVSENTKRRVHQALESLGYIPNLIARGLKTSTQFIGVISHDMRNPYFIEVMAGIESVLRQAGRTMVHVNSNDDLALEERNIYQLLSTRVEGMLLLSNLAQEGHPMIETAKKQVPIVVVEGSIQGVPAVNTDNAKGTRLALEHLWELGHRDIGYCSLNNDIYAWRSRFKAYCEFMEEQHAYNEDYVFIGEDYIDQLSYYHHVKQLPSALFAMNDSNALNVYSWCRDKQIRIPEDLSIVGFDDLPVSSIIDPPLTTVSQPVKEIGELAAHTLLAVLNAGQEKPQKNVHIVPELKVRGSVKRLNEHNELEE